MSAKNKKYKKGGLLAILVLILVAVLVIAIPDKPQASETEESSATSAETQSVLWTPQENESDEDAGVILKSALQLHGVASYIGDFVEDGTDEVVSYVLALRVTNLTADPIQYAQIHLPVGDEVAEFTVAALPSGESALLLEKNRMPYIEGMEYDLTAAECTALAGFNNPLSMHEDKLQIQCLDGALNITNISGEDITETIVLCYKNYQNGIYYGGIAYRIRLEGGLKADEVRQLRVEHFHQPGSRLVFVDFQP